jgi:guanylate kinase
LSERSTSLFVVSGPSGAGKSTILTRVLQELPALRFSVSHTTRAPRQDQNERDGVDYHFVSRAEFERLRDAGRFLEWAEVHGELYGTSLDEYERAERDGVDLLLDLDVKGAQQFRGRFPDAVRVFILPPSYGALERRLRTRGSDDEASFQRRLSAAGQELTLYRHYDYAIINEELEGSVEDLKAVVRAARCRTGHVQRVADEILSTFPHKEG